MMGLTEEQKLAAHAPGSVAVTAGAGTGKTHMLAERYLYFLRQGYSPLQIVAVTFTKKAASELRSRIRKTIAAQLPGENNLLTELEAAQISTFHTLASRICQEHPDQANVPYNFSIQDEIESPVWIAQAFTQALTQLPISLFDQIPYSLMKEILLALLADPLTAEQALERSQSDWLPVMEQARQQALDDLLNDPQWLISKSVLESHTAPKDKLEVFRSNALGAIAALEQGHEIAPSLEILASLKINVGSAKNWGGKECISDVKDAIKQVRELVKNALEIGLITLEINEYDQLTEDILPSIREGFSLIRESLRQAKYQQRFLDYNDLEVHALQALEIPEVQQYYARRWQIFLIDEFQDTNPIQGQLLEQLTENSYTDSVKLTIVGDTKQSIYGFRRADVRIFESWQQRIHSISSPPIELSRSFRTHHSLMMQINQLFKPILGKIHQSLDAERKDSLNSEPKLQLFTVVVDDKSKKDDSIDTNVDACRRVEAQKIADLIQEMLKSPIQIHDKATNQYRDIQPKDVAILARNWGPLEIYGSAISARGIPILQVGGGNLLETREAKDAWTLLQFLADPSDSLALSAILRSPFFALSDRLLYSFAQSLPDKSSWWSLLHAETSPDFKRPVRILQELLRDQRSEMSTRLLQKADHLTGYTAIISNLPGADRRRADWDGFCELVRSLEHGNHDVFAVVRRLRQILKYEVSIPRPALEGGDAVSLMTIHSSKGLEWPVVVVPDLSHQGRSDSPKLRFDPDLGLGLKLADDQGDLQKSALYSLLDHLHKDAEASEAKRILYVALTRARDQLILSSAQVKGGSLDVLQPGIEGVVSSTPIPFDEEKTKPVELAEQTRIVSAEQNLLLNSMGAGFSELSVTALNDYVLCPLRFKFRHLDGHPGYQSGDGIYQYAMEMGRLTHKSLELNIEHASSLAKYAPELPLNVVEEAQILAGKFRTSSIYSPYYSQPNLRWEQPVSFSVGNLTLNGIIDLLGNDFVLDFKTDKEIKPTHHELQLWAYQKATGKSQALLAYLRHDHIALYDTKQLSEFDDQANFLISEMLKGQFEPTPNTDSCGICPFAEICDDKVGTANL